MLYSLFNVLCSVCSVLCSVCCVLCALWSTQYAEYNVPFTIQYAEYNVPFTIQEIVTRVQCTFLSPSQTTRNYHYNEWVMLVVKCRSDVQIGWIMFGCFKIDGRELVGNWWRHYLHRFMAPQLTLYSIQETTDGWKYML